MAKLVNTAYPIFTDIDGTPLEEGYIEADVSLFWDEALTLPATNVRTKGGIPDNGGVAGRLFSAGEYTLTVKNRKTYTVYSAVISPDNNVFENGIELSSGRKALEELTSGALTVSGWYTIAETDLTNFDTYSGKITISDKSTRNCILVSEFAGSGSSVGTKTIEKLKHITYNTAIYSIKGIRLAYSTTINDSGAKLQVYMDIPSGSSQLTIQLVDNTARTGTGMVLVQPTQTNINLLPDGVTVGTFLEAGAELSFTDSAHINPFNVTKTSNDQLLCTAHMAQIPKQGTSLTITYPASGLLIRDGAATQVTLTTETVSNFIIDGNNILFRLNNTGAFATLSSSPCVVLTNGTGGKLTITG